MQEYAWFAAGLAVVVACTLGLAHWARLGLGWLPGTALLRAAIQLTVIALLLRGILALPWTVFLFVVLMLSTASWTAMARLREIHHGRRTAVVGVLVGSLTAIGLVFALRLVNWEARYLIAVAGILVGNAMSAATLAGRNFARGSRAGAGVIEGWLALGATPGQAHDEIGREAARESLIPTLDQSRATGLVTLPGAFVGALFGGASPAVAAQFQLVVLAGIALAMTVTAVIVTRLAGRTPYVLIDSA